uniref:Uncharacterized protein n=1 Tax=viral metagenome TaxID=1070528 RepID=A0A6M3X502_9ZZZZ
MKDAHTTIRGKIILIHGSLRRPYCKLFAESPSEVHTLVSEVHSMVRRIHNRITEAVKAKIKEYEKYRV